ncbi:hypothetical protein ANCDUO_19627, partial [Ancylostoma duodenale]
MYYVWGPEHLHTVPASFRRPFSSCQLVLPPESSVHHVACPSDDECSDTPLASEVGIYICEQVAITCLMQLMFRGVPTKRLNDVEAKCMDEVIKEHLLDNTWDMKRMGDLITKIAKAELRKMEERPDEQLFECIIGHQLYNRNEEQLRTRLNR